MVSLRGDIHLVLVAAKAAGSARTAQPGPVPGGPGENLGSGCRRGAGGTRFFQQSGSEAGAREDNVGCSPQAVAGAEGKEVCPWRRVT